MRVKFLEQLQQLNTMLTEMGMYVETIIAMAVTALKTQDKELAQKTIEYDHDINRMERDIESLCLKILLQQHPVAKDLRLVSAALKMITDMERIGDQSADIAEISIYLTKPFYKELEHIRKMAKATVKMVTDSVDAFVKKDLELAKSVIKSDDTVDDLFTAVKTDLIDLIRADSESGEQAIDLIMIAKYFERIGDHAVNIAEWVVFAITGKHAKKRSS